MNICDDCNIHDCDLCTAPDCDCYQLSHTIAPTVVIQQALEQIIDPDLGIELIANGEIELALTMNRRRYRVIVEPA